MSVKGFNAEGVIHKYDFNALENIPSINGVTLMGDHDSSYYNLTDGEGSGGIKNIGYVTPQQFGAKGDGVTDDSVAFQQAFNEQKGLLLIPDGIYVVTGLITKSNIRMVMSEKAVLLQKKAASTSEVMISIGENCSLEIIGGTIDFNELNMGIRPYHIAGSIFHDQSLRLKSIIFKHISKAGVYLSYIGGHIVIEDCVFLDTLWGTSNNQPGTLFSCQGGEVDHSADIHILNNRAISFCYNDTNMTSAPGGFFLSCKDDTEDLAHGNMSFVEVRGNYFHGFGLYYDVNVIYPIHFYPLWGGVIISDNKFEKCMCGAICIKSCEDTIISNNVILDGIRHDAAAPMLPYGVISYTPNHHGSADYSRKRAVISGNIIDSTSGTVENPGYGIAVIGTSDNSENTYCDSVVISNNVITNAGFGILVAFSRDVDINNNILKKCNGIRWQTCAGLINISNNIIYANDGVAAILGVDASPEVIVHIKNNYCSGSNITLLQLRGTKELHVSGNQVILTEGSNVPVVVNKYNSSSPKVSRLVWFDNHIVAPSSWSQINWTNIDSVYGKFEMYNWVDTIPAEFGTTFVDYVAGKMYIQTKRDHSASGWKQVALSASSVTLETEINNLKQLNIN